MQAANCLNHSTVHAWPHRHFTRFDIEMEAAPTGALTHDVTSWKITVWALMFVLPLELETTFSKTNRWWKKSRIFVWQCQVTVSKCVRLQFSMCQRLSCARQQWLIHSHWRAERERERYYQKGHRLCCNECWFSDCWSRSRMVRRIAGYVNMTTQCAPWQCMFSYCTRNFDQSLPGLRVLSWTYCWRARKPHKVQQTVKKIVMLKLVQRTSFLRLSKN